MTRAQAVWRLATREVTPDGESINSVVQAWDASSIEDLDVIVAALGNDWPDDVSEADFVGVISVEVSTGEREYHIYCDQDDYDADYIIYVDDHDADDDE